MEMPEEFKGHTTAVSLEHLNFKVSLPQWNKFRYFLAESSAHDPEFERHSEGAG